MSKDEISRLIQENGKLRVALMDILDEKNWATARHMDDTLCWINRNDTPVSIYSKAMNGIKEMKPASEVIGSTHIHDGKEWPEGMNNTKLHPQRILR